MAAKLGTGGGPMADINVTPLIDVVLVLLVVFMVITPMLQSGMPVDLPKATQTTSVNDVGQHIVVSVTYDKGVWVEQVNADMETCKGENRGPGFCDLVDLINVEFQANPSRSILIKADGRLEYHKVREVMDIIGENGMTTQLVAAAKEE
jgi:biopolymer transport protein ExbD/biopolymer transport protein TolR